MFRSLLVISGVFFSGIFGAAAVAQTPPATDIFLVSLEVGEESVKLGQPKNVTRRAGYDNQPHFLPDGKSFVYTTIGEDGQADIWAYDLKSEAKRPVVETPKTSEYSPTPIPGENAISVIRVEEDGETQRLWRFPLVDGKQPDVLLPDIKPVGYHAWLTDESLALFVLGEPHTLQFASRGPGEGRLIASDIGRALHKVPGRPAASFIHKDGKETWQIKKAGAGGNTKALATTRPGREDFTWLPNGDLLMGDGSVLYRAAPGGEWEAVADFKDAGLSDISRVAVHPKGTWLAFVAVSGAD